MTKIAGSGSGSESISQRLGSADPDPPQNVMDPQHSSEVRVRMRTKMSRIRNTKGSPDSKAVKKIEKEDNKSTIAME
jgi:hypothetical protein